MLNVKVVQIPGTMKDVVLNGEHNVSAALSAAEIRVQSNHTIQVNGRAADGNTLLAEGDRVVVSKGAKGA